MKIGLMGGSFDPVHFGHIQAAKNAIGLLGLDRVIMIPAGRTPAKAHRAPTAAHHRIAMLHAAIDGDDRFEVSDFEVSRDGLSYTIDTVRRFKDRHPVDEFFWILGSDKIASLENWRSIGEIAELVEFISVGRPGYPAVIQHQGADVKIHRCEDPTLDISSTELRRRILDGESLERFLPPQVIVYIGQNNLYQ